MCLSISQISDLAGRERRMVAKQLKDLHYTTVERGTFLYESAEALPLVYVWTTQKAARAAQGP